MRGRTSVVLSAIAALTAACTTSTKTPSAPTTSTTMPAATDTRLSVVTPPLASVIAAPIPVPATDGKVHLAYELPLTNALNQELALTSVDVRAMGNLTPTTKLASAQSAAVWLDVVLDRGAVADGRVVGVVDGLPEQVPGKSPSGLTLEQYAGNHIVQAIGDGNYVLYAHLKTGSVKVNVGERLSSGQVMSTPIRCGPTGCRSCSRPSRSTHASPQWTPKAQSKRAARRRCSRASPRAMNQPLAHWFWM